MGAILKWFFDDIWHLIAVILTMAVIVFYFAWIWESHQATKYQTQAIKFENAFNAQKVQTVLCEKNKSALLVACNENNITSHNTLNTCDRLLKICEKKKGGECLDKETLDELGVITDRFNNGMSLSTSNSN